MLKPPAPASGPLRIARFIYDWPPPWMGLAPGPYEITRTQASMGHRVTVFCGGRPGVTPEPIPEVRIVTVPRALKGILAFTSAPGLLLRYLLFRLRHRVDVVHGHAHVTQWYNLWRLLFGGRTPYFYHLHITFKGREEALLAKGYRFSPFERINNLAGGLCDRWGCKAADHVFAVNDSVKEEAVRLLGVPPRRITVIRNGVNTDLFRKGPRNAGLAVKLDLPPEGGPVILYVGVLNARKNLGMLLDTLARLPGFRLLLAGSGPEAYRDELSSKAAGLGISPRVRFAGYVDYPELPAYYSLADVFVLPSLYEGMPKVLLEALASGKPAIVHSGYTLDPALEEFVEKADCTDPEDLAGSIDRLARSGFKGNHETYLRTFSWKTILGEVEALYSQQMKSRNPWPRKN